MSPPRLLHRSLGLHLANSCAALVIMRHRAARAGSRAAMQPAGAAGALNQETPSPLQALPLALRLHLHLLRACPSVPLQTMD